MGVHPNTSTREGLRMQYQMEVIINLPRERVIDFFDSFENLKEWQEGLVSHEPISGEPGQAGRQDQTAV